MLYHVGAEINAQDGDSAQWEWDAEEDVHEEGRDL